MMTKQQRVRSHAGKDLITRRAGRCFEAKAAVALNRNMRHLAWNALMLAVIDAESGPLPGIRRQTVMHVNGIQALAEAKFNENMEEDDRIAAAGKTDAQAPVASSPGGEKRSDPGRELT